MNIEQLNSSKILISLCDKELEGYDLTFEKLNLKDHNARMVIEHILHHAEVRTGMTFKNQRLVIETMKYEHGCLMLITIIRNSLRKRYKVLARSTSYAFYFNNTENLLRCIEQLYLQKETNHHASLLFDGKGYYLILTNTILHSSFLLIANEYACSMRKGKFYCTGLKEQFQTIVAFNAIEKIGSVFCTG